MLVLSRKAEEKILIGGRGDEALYVKRGDEFVQIAPIVVLCVEVRGDKVWLGIEAHRAVAVHREEVFQAIQRERSGAK